ncbi:MAG: hypothetical protein LBG79_06230 [Spirochaetaceae bacterium]|nr:hypothetical protein [Spirochaetaceae bacterium]
MIYSLDMRTLLVCLTALFITACFSFPAAINNNTTAEELVQYAQTAMDRDQHKLAIYYYEEILKRFSNNDEKVCDAEYGIASVHYKQRRYKLAKEEFEEILQKYNGPSSKNLPKKYQILSKIRLERIAEKQKSVPKFLQRLEKT